MSVCVYCFQHKLHPGVLAKAEENRPFLSHADTGSGELGASGPPEPCPNLCEGERRGSQQYPEDPIPPGEPLHGECGACGFVLCLHYPQRWGWLETRGSHCVDYELLSDGSCLRDVGIYGLAFP